MKSINRVILTAFSLLFASTVFDGVFHSAIMVEKADAILGVARRTTRRMIRRSTIYVASLPAGCSTVVIEGTTLSQCGSTYYQPYNNQYVVVYVDD